MRHHPLFILMFLCILSLSPFPAAGSETTPTVVELFTSEGCSSCPPAEALLRDLADEPGVLALEFHVDYWDYIGWPDPYADPAFSQRQRTYADFFESRTLYTPQMVFQGIRETPGSRTTKVRENLVLAQALPKIPVSLTLAENSEMLLVIAAVDHTVDADLLLVSFDDFRESVVTRGENAGKTLTHRHVVRSIQSIGSWDGSALNLTRSLPQSPADTPEYAVLVQARENGHILGAARLATRP